jgi:hypothetical protein
MTDREPPALMTGTERASYCAWLVRFVGRRKGTLSDYLRSAANQLSGRFA